MKNYNKKIAKNKNGRKRINTKKRFVVPKLGGYENLAPLPFQMFQVGWKISVKAQESIKTLLVLLEMLSLL